MHYTEDSQRVNYGRTTKSAWNETKTLKSSKPANKDFLLFWFLNSVHCALDSVYTVCTGHGWSNFLIFNVECELGLPTDQVWVAGSTSISIKITFHTIDCNRDCLENFWRVSARLILTYVRRSYIIAMSILLSDWFIGLSFSLCTFDR